MSKHFSQNAALPQNAAGSGRPAQTSDPDVLPLAALGWDDQVEAAFADVPVDLDPGRVVRVDRGRCVVALDDGEHPARPTLHVGVGDWVGVRRRLDDLSVQAVVPRWSQLSRRDAQGLLQLLATNIDLVIITAPADRLSIARVERETVAAWDSGAAPLVVVTKNDLAGPGLVEDLRARLVGIDVLTTSSVTREGIASIAQALRPCRTAVLLGPSGAGKSSLANCLLGSRRFPTSQVRAGDHRGRHTTTSRQLVAVPGGGVLIDTPGLRAMSLSGAEGLSNAFRDVEHFAEGCRFSDCEHQHEPACAVLAAVDSGELDPDRLSNYRKLQKELAFEARKNDPLARAEEERIWKIRSKAGKQIRRERDR